MTQLNFTVDYDFFMGLFSVSNRILYRTKTKAGHCGSALFLELIGIALRLPVVRLPGRPCFGQFPTGLSSYRRASIPTESNQKTKAGHCGSALFLELIGIEPTTY